MSRDNETVERETNPQMSDHFAQVYEEAATRITGPVSRAALEAAGPIFANTRILDIAAGAGALSVPAAELGAEVLAVDVAPGMVRRLSANLEKYANARAEVMDGEALELPDDAFDRTFSIFGVMTFSDWRRGLAEQVRVTKPEGIGCVVTWREPPGGGPFQVLLSALAKVFPDRPTPPWPEGFTALSDPERLISEMSAAGFEEVSVNEITGIWEGPSGQRYLDEIRELYGYVKPYAALSPDDRERVDEAIREVTGQLADGDLLRLASPVLVAIGRGTKVVTPAIP